MYGSYRFGGVLSVWFMVLPQLAIAHSSWLERWLRKCKKRPIESEATKPTTLLSYVSKCVCVVLFSSFCKGWESATTSQILRISFAKQDWAKQQILFLLCKSGLQKAEPKTSSLSITVVDRICYRYAILPSYQTLFYISCMIKKQKYLWICHVAIDVQKPVNNQP